ncbi:MAG: KTSC domain-containing protein [Rhodoferax sp.]
MPTHTFRSGRIRQAQYDPAMRHLELLWDDKTVRAYQPVPEEVFRRLCQAPNPATYWEDRIAEEYPSARPRRAAGAPDAAQQFKDLFGGSD